MSAKKTASTVAVCLLHAALSAHAAVAQLSTVSTGSGAAPTVTSPRPAAAAMASRTARAPLIDGRDDDDIWHSAVPATGFRMFDPTEDGEPSMRTAARFA
jgi:hypothetical protein